MRARAGPAPRARRRARAGILSLSSSTRRSAVFFPTPGMRVRRARSLARRAATKSPTSMPERMPTASLGPDAGDGDQALEDLLLGGGQEAVQGQRVLAHLGVDAQAQLVAFVAHAGRRSRPGWPRGNPPRRRPPRLPGAPCAGRGRGGGRSRDAGAAAAGPRAWRGRCRGGARGRARPRGRPRRRPPRRRPARPSSRATIIATWTFSARPKPVTWTLTVAGAKAVTGIPAAAPARSTAPRTWPRTSALRVFTAWKRSSTARASGWMRAMTSTIPRWMKCSRSARPRAAAGASTPFSTSTWRRPSVSMTP